ncbi:MAG TPA: gamma carbonic anhydrase family protein [Polyangiaceae bacterium]|jgi:carbonic anhydrase/acetyltransferase-like protein (isoleucine patch superfamily)|nr:gamma carbonic anhydrase family protein [Polyangiaceae bacterium]
MAVYGLGPSRPLLASSVFVAESAAVIGDVHVGDDSSIWFGAVVRGDYFPIRIGARTNVQDNAVLHITSGRAATTVGDDVTVGHGAILHGCTVGSSCLVGMASVILDGAVVGEQSFIAAGSLVAPGTVIPPRSFALGRPAKVLRSVRDDELVLIQTSAHNYVGYAQAFGAGCRRLDTR